MRSFYLLGEVQIILDKTEDEVKALVRAGKLKEFRDAGRLNYKAEEVNSLAGLTPGCAETMMQKITQAMQPKHPAKPITGLSLMHPQDQMSCLTAMVQRKVLDKEQFMPLIDRILDAGGFTTEASNDQKDEAVRGRVNSQLCDMKFISEDEFKTRIAFDDFVKLTS